MVDRPLKQKALDSNLPRHSALRSYLSEKSETAKYPRPSLVPHYVRVEAISNPKVLLVMPPMCLYEGAVKRVVPPLGLCYIAAALEEKRFDTTILDCIVEGIPETTLVAPGTWRF